MSFVNLSLLLNGAVSATFQDIQTPYRNYIKQDGAINKLYNKQN